MQDTIDYNIIDDAKEYICINFPFAEGKIIFPDEEQTHFDYNESVRGETPFNFNENDNRICFKILRNHPQDIEWGEEYHITSVLVALFHECYGHGCQIIQESKNNSILSKSIILNSYAYKLIGYDQYSGKFFQEYFNQISEISAQYQGIKNAYIFLSLKIGQEKANELICNYVNKRIDNNSEFIRKSHKKNFVYTKDVLSAFNDVFVKNMYKHRLLPKSDWVARFNSRFPEANKNEIGYIISCRNGLWQDLMLTSILFDLEFDKLNRIFTSQALEDVKDICFNMKNHEFHKQKMPLWIKQHDHKGISLESLYIPHTNND